MNRTITRSLILSLCVLTLLGFAFALFLRSKQPQYKGERKLSGLVEKVEVSFDKWAIPHINAKSEKDAYYSLGYLHAQERLFQMEVMRRLAKGELAEILGPEVLKYDKFFRTVGIQRVAKKLARKYLYGNSASTAFQAYLNGINEFIKTGPRPIEFVALGVEPRAFEASDSFAIAGYMAFSFFKGLQTDPLVHFLAEELPKDFKKDILAFEKLERGSLVGEKTLQLDQVAMFAQNFFQEPFSLFDGSNAWVISGKRTRSGKPILANDPHIGFSSPSVWFEAAIKYPDFELYGHHLAGVPVALLGHNKTHGWGLTMLQNKDSDFYKEKVNPENPMQYWFNGHWEEMSSFVEEFKVKGEKDVQIDVRVTRHGPVINEVIDGFKDVESPISFKWSFANEENQVIEALYGLAHADSLEKAEVAIEKIYAPGLNVLYANAKGDIAWWAAARFPIRKADAEGRFILEGTGSDEYLGYHPFSSNPRMKNPKEGFIASANHDPFHGHPYKIAGYYNPDYRIDKLIEILSKKEAWTVDDNKELQLHTGNDSYGEIIQSWIPILENSQVMDTELKQASFTLLKTWDLQHSIESVGATVFHEVYGHLVEKVFQEHLPETFFEALKGTNLIHDATLQIILNSDSSWWLDKSDGLSKREEWVRKAWNDSIDSLESRLGKKPLKWSWGRVHTVTHKHAFGKVSWLASIFNVGPYAMSGSTETILNANFKLSSGSHEVYYGPSTRRIIDFINPSESWGINPTGQSGYFANSHYQDQTALYLQGEYRMQILDPALIDKPKQLSFVPKR